MAFFIYVRIDDYFFPIVTYFTCNCNRVLKVREEEENNLPQMKKLFFLYVWLNLTRIAELRKEDLVKEIK